MNARWENIEVLDLGLDHVVVERDVELVVVRAFDGPAFDVGGLNRISPYIWSIRERLLAFKTARRQTYYAIKLTLIWSALLAVFVFGSIWVREGLWSLF